jgi:hypothetical protein
MNGRFEIIDAFVDGETVDPVALKQALSEPEGRDHLVDAWLLRDLVQEEMATDAAAPPPRAAAPARRAWRLAAMVAGVCLIGGYAIGARFPAILGTPPAAPSEAAIGPVASSPSSTVPVPTRVIRLEFDPAVPEGSGGR